MFFRFYYTLSWSTSDRWTDSVDPSEHMWADFRGGGKPD